MSTTAKAICAMLAASLLSPVIGAMVRLLPADINNWTVVNLSFALFIPASFACMGGRTVEVLIRQKCLFVLRTILTLLSIGSTFAAIRHIDFASAYFANMMGIFAAGFLSGLFLKEKAGITELALAVFMLLGGAIALSPELSTSAAETGLLAVVLLSCSGRVLVARMIGKTESAMSLTILSMGAMALLLLPASIEPIGHMTKGMIGLFAVIGITNLLSVCLASYAYSKGSIPLVAPIELIKLCFAVSIGYLVFSDHISAQLILGLVIISAAIIVHMFHEFFKQSRSFAENHPPNPGNIRIY